MNQKHIIITTIFVLLICGGTASAWLSGYDHRMAITVNNGGAATLNYYQFNFTNDTNTLVAAGNVAIPVGWCATYLGETALAVDAVTAGFVANDVLYIQDAGTVADGKGTKKSIAEINRTLLNRLTGK